MRRNPRKTSWTVLYRRKHKKGSVEESVKKRTRRTVKHTRAIQGASLQEILMKRNQKPEVRKAQREQALRAAKAKIAEKKDRQKSVKVLLDDYQIDRYSTRCSFPLTGSTEASTDETRKGNESEDAKGTERWKII